MNGKSEWMHIAAPISGGTLRRRKNADTMKYTSAVSALHGSAARNSGAYLLVVFGLVSAFGPFLTDFYLPALPALAD